MKKLIILCLLLFAVILASCRKDNQKIQKGIVSSIPDSFPQKSGENSGSLGCGYLDRGDNYDVIYLTEVSDNAIFQKDTVCLLRKFGEDTRLTSEYQSGDYLLIRVLSVEDSNPRGLCYTDCCIISDTKSPVKYSEIEGELLKAE